MSHPKVSINCPKCKKLLAQSLAPLNAGFTLRCPGCGAVHRFMDDDLRKPQMSIDIHGKLRFE